MFHLAGLQRPNRYRGWIIPGFSSFFSVSFLLFCINSLQRNAGRKLLYISPPFAALSVTLHQAWGPCSSRWELLPRCKWAHTNWFFFCRDRHEMAKRWEVLSISLVRWDENGVVPPSLKQAKGDIEMSSLRNYPPPPPPTNTHTHQNQTSLTAEDSSIGRVWKVGIKKQLHDGWLSPISPDRERK